MVKRVRNSFVNIRVFAALLVSALAASLLAQGPAAAAPLAPPVVTSSTFAAWDVDYQGTYNPDLTPVDKTQRNLRTVSGTSSGTPGDTLEIYCVTRDPLRNVKLVGFVDVDAAGAWTATISIHDLYTKLVRRSSSCKIAAAWQGEKPPTFADIAGSEVHVMQITPTVRNGVFEDLWFGVNGTEGFVDFGSNANCSLCDTYVANPEDNAFTDRTSALFWWNAALWGAYINGPAIDTSLLTVDGREVWGGYNVNRYVPLSDAALRSVEISYSLDQATGILTFTESERLSYCPADSSLTQPSDAACVGALEAKMIDAGVTHRRVTTIGPDGTTYNVDDLFESTDGKSHVIDVRYLESSIADNGAETDIKLPAGVSGAAGDTWIDGASIDKTLEVTGFTPGVTAIQFTRHWNQSPAYTNPVGVALYSDAPDKVSGITSSTIAVEFLNKTVDMYHSFSMGVNYAWAASQAKLDQHSASAFVEVANYQPAANITWNPSVAVKVTATRLSALATSAAGVVSYRVSDAGTTSCTIDRISGAVSFAAPGTCKLTATVGATRTSRLTSKDVTLSVLPLCSFGAAGTVKFFTDSPILSGTAKKQLRTIASIIKADRCSKISIVGDGPMTKKVKGSFVARKSAATKRASAVKVYLASLLKGLPFKVTITATANVRSDSAAIDKDAAAAKSHLKATVSGKR